MFWQKYLDSNGKDVIQVSGIGSYSLKDSFECGQCFRHRLISDENGKTEYMTVIENELIIVSQSKPGELFFYGISEEIFERIVIPYFSLDRDYQAIKADIISKTDSDWLKRAAEYGKGIAIFKQNEWEALFSFIVSQNNNIPRIKKIIAQIAGAYGVNICLQKGLKKCPLSLTNAIPCDKECRSCGACYTFPRPEDVLKNPEGLLPSKPGFRYKYLLDAAEKVLNKEIDLDEISKKKSYEHTLSELKKILGVGDKVASCTALFGFGNLEAFPIDVWMKKAIDEYFGGKLDPISLGEFAGVAQQYIFHYIRNREGNV